MGGGGGNVAKGEGGGGREGGRGEKKGDSFHAGVGEEKPRGSEGKSRMNKNRKGGEKGRGERCYFYHKFILFREQGGGSQKGGGKKDSSGGKGRTKKVRTHYQ